MPEEIVNIEDVVFSENKNSDKEIISVNNINEEIISLDDIDFGDPEDNKLMYRFQTEGSTAAWGKSTDGGVTFEVVDAGDIPEDWFNDPKFKQVYKQQTSFKAEDFKKQPKVDLEGVARQTLAENLPAFMRPAIYLDNALNIIKSLVTDKKEREEIYTGAGNVVKNTGDDLQNFFTRTLPAEISRVYKTVAFNDLYDKEELEYLKTLDPNTNYEDPMGDPTGFKTNADRIKYLEGYKETSFAKEEEKINKFIAKKYKEIDVYNKYLKRDTGEGIVKGAKQGDASDVILGVFNASASMVQTVVPAMLTGGFSLPFQITAPMMMDYNQQKAERVYGKDDPDAVLKLLKNKEDEIAIPAALGLIATGLEYVGYKGITKYILGKGTRGIVPSLVLTSNKEGFTELGQSGIEEVNSALAQGKEGLDLAKAFIDGVYSEKGLEAYLGGFIGSTSMSVGGRAVNRALRSDNASVKELNSLIDDLSELNIAKNSAKNTTAKEAIEVEIKQSEQALKKYIKEKRKIADILNEDQKQNLIDAINEKDNITSKVESLKSQLNNNEISSKEFGYAIRSLNNQDKRLTEQIEAINESAKQQLLVTGLEATKEEGETVGLKQELFETKEQYAALFGKKGSKKYNEALKADGHISDDGSTYYVNMDTAREAGAIGVGSHELLHGIIGKSFSKLKPEAKRKLNENFLNLLSKRDKETVLNRLAGAYGVTGDKVFTTEELYTAFSDEIVDGGVKFNEGVFGKVANIFEDVLRQLSSAGYFSKESFLYRKEFGNARQAYNFVKDYSLTIKKTGKVTQRAKEFAKEDPGSEGGLASKTITDAVDKLGKVDKDGNNLEEKGTGNFYYQAEADNVVKEIKEKGYLDNLIAAKYKTDKVPKNFVSDVITALTPDIKRFKPEENNSLFGYLQGRITFRAGDVYNKIYKQKEENKGSRQAGETTKEGEVKIQVAAETTSEMKQLEEKDMSIQAQIQEKADKQKAKQQAESKFRKILGLETGGVLYMKVLDAARKSLLRAYSTKDTVRQIQRSLRDQANTYLFKDVKNLLGTNKYEANLKQYREIIMESLFVSDLVQMERETSQDDRVFTKFVKKLTTKKEVEDAVNQNLLPPSAINAYNKDKSVNLYQKGNPTEKQFLSYFMIPAINPITGLRSGKKGTRKDTLAKNIAGALTYDATLQVAQEPEIVEKRQELADISNTEILKDDLQVLAASINRDPNIKFSNTLNKTTYNQKIIKVKSGKVYVDFTQAQNVVNDIFNNNSKVNFYRNLTDAEANKYGGKFIVEAIIDQYDSRGIERIDNKTIVKFIKKRKRRKDKVSTVYEQFFIELADAAIKQTKADITINQYVREGGVPDVHFQFEGSSIGLEIKMDSARGVSYTWKFDDTSTNPNPVDESATKELINKIKNTSKNNIFSNIDFLKGVIPKDLLKLKTFKHMFNHSVKVTGKYLEHHYTNKKMPEYFINIGDAGLFYMLGKQGDVNNAEVLRVAKELNIPRLSGSFDLISRMSIGSARKNGSRSTSIRIEPRIDSKSTENFNKKSSVNLSNKNDMDNFVKELNSSLIKISKNKNSKTIGSAIKQSRSTNNPTKGITVLDFDDTLATTKSLVKFTRPDGTTGTLNAEQYASTYENLLDQGYTFDFSEFNKVVKGKLAPLFQKALKLQSKFGPKNMFVLTARPPAAQKAIFDFLKANGLNIPINNITGLGNSTAESKALWVADKVGEGYNDFYFADDALQNVKAVKNMLDQFDVKSKVQQAKLKFSKSMNEKFNDILQEVTGIESRKRFAAIKGRKRGEGKGKFRFFIPPSHEDFVGLLYNFLGKGKEGNAHRDFFEQALVRPLNRANREYDTARQSIANDFKALNKRFPDVKSKLPTKTPDGDFTYQDAVRIYLWNKHGYDIPGLSEIDLANLVEIVMSDTELQAYAENINVISKQETYVKPTDGWNSGDLRVDLDDATGRVGREQYFTEFLENVGIVFSEENLNKIEAGYGKGVRSALEDILYRIKTGKNRPTGQNEQVNKLMNYLNGSVGTVMFFNMRSALLQQMSIVNYINFADNNIFAVAKTFANQEQYWADWSFIFNSDMLKQRRGGIQTDVNGAELAASLRNSKDITRKLISKLLELGFLPTQIGDNVAIATGGASYYRNRINTYLKQGLSKKEAEARAFTDFQDITQSTQQSARPDMVSQQQASVIGKVILNFQNVTSQFNRLGKKAFQDIYNRRITKPNTTQMQSDISNASRITYYFAVQNAIFYTLQTALFAMMFDDDEEDNNKLFLKKKERLINGSIDSVLRGSGLIGGVIATLKNVAIAFARQRDVKYNPDESAVALEALNLSPVLGIKIRKIVNAEKTLNYNKKVIKEMETFDIDNPQWSAVTSYTESLTNIPLNRLYNKTQNVRQALNNEHSAWERSLMFLGWSQYNLNLKNKKMEEIKAKTKKKKRNTGRKTITRKTIRR